MDFKAELLWCDRKERTSYCTLSLSDLSRNFMADILVVTLNIKSSVANWGKPDEQHGSRFRHSIWRF